MSVRFLQQRHALARYLALIAITFFVTYIYTYSPHAVLPPNYNFKNNFPISNIPLFKSSVNVSEISVNLASETQNDSVIKAVSYTAIQHKFKPGSVQDIKKSYENWHDRHHNPVSLPKNKTTDDLSPAADQTVVSTDATKTSSTDNKDNKQDHASEPLRW